MKIPLEGAGEDAVFDLTPMIDCVFLLLVFFMVTTTFLDPERQIEIELPRAASGTAPEREPEEIVIHVSRDGAVTLGGETVDRDALVTGLTSSARRDPATPVTIRGDRLAAHEAIVGVMDACRAAGLSNLSVGTAEEI